MKRKTLGLFLVAFFGLATSASTQPTGPELIAISAADRQAASPDIAIGVDGSINLIWVDKGPAAARPAGPPPGGHTHKAYNDLYFARSTDQGRTFSPPVRITTTPGELWGFATSKPRIAVSKSGVIHVFYHGNRNDRSAERQAVDARYTRSTDGGRTFEPARTLNTFTPKAYDDGELNEAHCFGTMGVAPDGSVHAFWIDTRHMTKSGDNGAVYGAVSRDEGKSFERERLVFKDEACPCCQLSTVASADGKVYLSLRSVYADGSRDGSVARSDDGGKTFSQRARVSDKKWMINGCPLKPTTLTVDKDGRVFAVWYAGEVQPAGVFFSVSEDRGKTFSRPIAAHPEAKISDHAQIAAGPDGAISLIWDAKVGENRRVYWRVSNDHGKTFGPVTELETPAGAADYPAIAVGPRGKTFIALQQDGRVMFQALPELVAQKQ